MPGQSSPSVGVVLPTRNRVSMLQVALASVWAQDYAGHIQVVVVFDGPAPPDLVLPEPIHPYHHLQLAENPGPHGLVATRTLGVHLLETEFIALLDDDDEWWPSRLTTQVELAQAHPEVELVGGGVRVVHKGAAVDRPPPAELITLSDLLNDRIMELHPSTFLIRRACLQEIGGWDAELPGGFAEDYDLLLRIARRGPLRLVPQIVANINWAGDSYFFSKWKVIADALEMLLDKYPEFATKARGRGRIRGQIAFARAASGDRRAAWRMLRLSLADNVREPRAVLAALVAAGLVSPDRVQAILHRRGRGI